MGKIHNFSAGPCILPQVVFEQAAQGVLNYDNTGLSIIEMSHRSKAFVGVMEEARSLVRESLNVPDNYEVLFLQGGASLGFLISAYNFMKEGGKAGYVNTGSWSSKALKEAKRLGTVNILASSEDANFNYIPKGYDIPSDLDYLHMTSNNTIFGTQYKSFPETEVAMVCDMSSDIFSKPVDVSRFDMIYAGAQKNLGPAGATLYIYNRDRMSGRDIPTMLDLNVHSSKDSMFNTPPVFSVFVSMLTLRWLKENGGVSWVEERNNKKASLLYDEIDRNALFEGTAALEDRSNMNVTFVLKDEAHKERFDEIWNNAGISGIKGHRSVGGYRASMYNAMDVDSAEALVNCMQELENKA